MSDSDPIKKRIPWWVWIAGIDLVLLLLTAAERIRPGWPYLWRLIDTAPLTHEMNLGSWWSSMCLFAVALVCYELSATKQADFKMAWLGLAFIVALLSFDEIGSVHERLGLISPDLGRFLFAAGLLAVIPLYVVAKLFRHPETKTASVLICIAFGLFASVAGQEWIEKSLPWSQFPRWTRVLRPVVEEGTELGAVLLLFAAVVTQRGGPGRKSFQALVVDPRNVRSAAVPLLVGLALNAAICLIVLPNLTYAPGPSYGNPAIWYPAVLGVAISGAAFWIGRDSSRWMGAAWKMIAVGFLLSSAALMTDLLKLVPWTPLYLMPDLWSRLVPVYGWQTILIAWMVRKEYLGAAAGAITMALAVVLASLHFRFADQQGLVLLLYSVFACAVGLAVLRGCNNGAPHVRIPVAMLGGDELSEGAT